MADVGWTGASFGMSDDEISLSERQGDLLNCSSHRDYSATGGREPLSRPADKPLLPLTPQRALRGLPTGTGRDLGSITGEDFPRKGDPAKMAPPKATVAGSDGQRATLL